MEKDNQKRLEQIARALGDLRTKVVFVGGSIVHLYADDPASTEPRPTLDIDIVVDLSSYADYNKFCEELRAKRFSNDMSVGAPICRWTFEDELIDVMPTTESPIGPSNRWYQDGFRRRIAYEISEGLIIHILPALFYVATKMEAVKSRGGNDLRISHDFEDLVYVLNYCQDIVEQYNRLEGDIKDYIRNEFAGLLARDNIREEVSCVLPYGDDGRTEYILRLMKRMG